MDFMIYRALIDEILDTYRPQIGADFLGLRNHCQRVFSFCTQLSKDATSDDLECFAIATAFHDLGIWVDKTFDYIEPSVSLAVRHLQQQGRASWIPDVVEMIRDHHKIHNNASHHKKRSEVFRKADWIDVSFGIRRFGISRNKVSEVRASLVNAGFHRCLMRLTWTRFKKHPLSPLPMMRF